MKDDLLKEEDRLLEFLQEDIKNRLPENTFSPRAIRELTTYNLIQILSDGNLVLTKKGKYVKRMIAAPHIEREKSGNKVLNFKLKKENTITAFQFFRLFLVAIIALLVRYLGTAANRWSSRSVYKSIEDTTEELVLETKSKVVNR